VKPCVLVTRATRLYAIIVKMEESSTHHAAEQTAGHVPDSLAEILYQPLVDGNITINSKITGQSRSAPEGARRRTGDCLLV